MAKVVDVANVFIGCPVSPVTTQTGALVHVEGTAKVIVQPVAAAVCPVIVPELFVLPVATLDPAPLQPAVTVGAFPPLV